MQRNVEAVTYSRHEQVAWYFYDWANSAFSTTVITVFLGTLLFGLALQWTGSYRIAILSVAIFFAIGVSLLLFVDVRRAIEESGNVVPKIV